MTGESVRDVPATPRSYICFEFMRVFRRGILPIHFDGGVGELVDEFGSYLLPFFLLLFGGGGGSSLLSYAPTTTTKTLEETTRTTTMTTRTTTRAVRRAKSEGGATFRATLDGHFLCRSRMQVQVGVIMCGGFWGQLMSREVRHPNSGNIMLWFRKYDFFMQ
jgi:hypothetical protein